MKRIVTIALCPDDATAGGGTGQVLQDTYVEDMKFNEETGILTTTRTDGKIWEIDFSGLKTEQQPQQPIPDEITQYVINNLLNLKYVINTQAEDYTLMQEDFNGYTIVNAVKDGDQTITIPKPASEDAIGRAVVIHKGAGEAGTLLYLETATGVELVARDITPLRRVGSSVCLIYLGNGKFLSLGELP